MYTIKSLISALLEAGALIPNTSEDYDLTGTHFRCAPGIQRILWGEAGIDAVQHRPLNRGLLRFAKTLPYKRVSAKLPYYRALALYVKGRGVIRIAFGRPREQSPTPAKGWWFVGVPGLPPSHAQRRWRAQMGHCRKELNSWGTAPNWRAGAVKKAKVAYHCSRSPELSVLVPSIDGMKSQRAVSGDGVYFTVGRPDYDYGKCVYAFSARVLRRHGAFEREGVLILPHAILLEHKPDGFCHVRDVLSEASSYELVKDKFDGQNVIRVADFHAYRHAGDTAKPPHVGWRIVGLLLAVFCLIVGLRRRNWKWLALARFLSGVGGRFHIPAHIAQEWDSRDKLWIWTNTYSIRPDPRGSLFWIVGTMTVRIKDGVVYGEDVYDFHPQPGQSVDRKRRIHRWAWSGGPGDPTKIPAKVWKIRLLPLIPASARRFFREADGRLEVSNNFWNFVGGRPFTSILEVKLQDGK